MGDNAGDRVGAAELGLRWRVVSAQAHGQLFQEEQMVIAMILR
jgi:hypothetical protein